MALLSGVLIGLASAYLTARVRAKTARGLAEQILANASAEAETIRKQADLAAKEEVFKRREDFEAESERVRRDLRDQDRRLEKRADILDQKLELINRKENEFTALGRSLADQQEVLRLHQAEVRQNLATQLESLQRISRLSPDERARCFSSVLKKTSKARSVISFSSIIRSFKTPASRSAVRF